MRRLLFIFLILVCVISLTACLNKENEEEKQTVPNIRPIPISEGLEFELNTDGKSYSVTGIGTCTDTEIGIPSTYNELPVTVIDREAFRSCTSITSVVIPDSVETIKTWAFAGCISLTSVTIGKGVTSIEPQAFFPCESLIEVCNKSSIDIANDTSLGYYTKHIITDESQSAIKYVEDYIFYDDGTDVYLVKYAGNETELTLPDYNGKNYGIWRYAFYSEYDITSVTFPNCITGIGACAFEFCKSLTSVTIPDSVTSMGDSVFDSCYSLASVTLSNNITSLGWGAFRLCRSLTSITIPDSVTSIGTMAFGYCTSLTSVTLSNNLISIGNYAFLTCDKLTSITIPNSVTSIGDAAFSECYLLKNIEVSEKNEQYMTKDGNLYTKDGTTLVQYIVSKTDPIFIIPEGVTNIGEGAFSGCHALVSVTIPSSVQKIGDYAFTSCYSLIEVCNKSPLRFEKGSHENGDIAFYARNIIYDETYSSLEYIGDYVFYDYDNRVYLVKYTGNETELTLPDYNGKKYDIWQYAFYDNDKITIVIIPETVTKIWNEAFAGCDSLTIYCEVESQPTDWHSKWNYSNCPVVWGYTGEENQ